jgi:uncharacterized protein (TIGR03437 family)
MTRFTPGIALLLCISLLDARQEKQTCGTHADTWREQLQLHRMAARVGVKRARKTSAVRLLGQREIAGKTVLPDIGNLAVLDDSDGVVARRNPFNLGAQTVRFLPLGSTDKYKFELAGSSYDAATAEAGKLVSRLDDDDTEEVALPFEFPFWGKRHRSLFINSDGNLTFGSGDASVTDRSLGRFTAGPPRIAGLFFDLDPTKARDGVRVTSGSNRFVVSWVQVPEYQDVGTGVLQTFQIRLYPDGTIEIAYSEVRTDDAVVGISPGNQPGGTSLVSFLTAQSGEYTTAVAERFAGAEEIDTITAAQKFYLNHDDSYDYLIFFNSLGIAAGSSAVAFETTVRNNRSGYGDEKVDIGAEAGSERRLQAIINMGQLTQYPKDSRAKVPARLTVGDTPLTVIGHEAGHLFLAFASVRDENDPNARPMLGRQTAHWDFKFNSEASLLEGNRIQDNGPNASPRFLTVATVEGYAPLDQYLMGLRAPEEVPDTFLVQNTRATNAAGSPRVGVSFDGVRRDIRIAEIIQAEGRRTPDHTVSQRKFRMAFVLITANGAEPSAADIEQVDTYRRDFEEFFAKATSGKAFADTSLKRALRVSTFPAAGVVAGTAATGSISVEKPVETPLTVLLRSSGGAIETPPSVLIPAGSTQAQFTFRGVRQGTDDLIAEPTDPAYETVQGRVQVAAAEALTLSIQSGDFQAAQPGSPLPNAIKFVVSDGNQLPYPGVPVQVTLAGGGLVDRTTVVTDENGVASFLWTPGASEVNELRAALPGGAAAVATALGKPAFASNSVVNAASFASGLTPGGIATIFGSNLSGLALPEVVVNGEPAQIFFAGPRQVNFFIPLSTPVGTAEVLVRTSAGASDVIRVPIAPVHPGIFFDAASGFGAILVSGTAELTQRRPVGPGDIIEIYATGLGTVETNANGLRETTAKLQVTIGGAPAEVLFSGLAPGFAGLYQVNVRVPAVTGGTQPLRLIMNGSVSNEVKVQLR